MLIAITVGSLSCENRWDYLLYLQRILSPCRIIFPTMRMVIAYVIVNYPHYYSTISVCRHVDRVYGGGQSSLEVWFPGVVLFIWLIILTIWRSIQRTSQFSSQWPGWMAPVGPGRKSGALVEVCCITLVQHQCDPAPTVIQPVCEVVVTGWC